MLLLWTFSTLFFFSTLVIYRTKPFWFIPKKSYPQKVLWLVLCYRLNWLPKTLPPFVKILVSTLPDDDIGCLRVLKRVLPPKNFVEVPKMTDETGKEILDTWLSRAGRTLTKEQYKLVMESFSKSPTPLYLKVSEKERVLSLKDVITGASFCARRSVTHF